MANAHNDAYAAMYRGMENLKHAIKAEIECAQIAKVIKYNAKKHVADIQPLAKTSDGQASAQYLDVPVAANCYLFDEFVDKSKTALEKGGFKLPKKKLMRKGAVVVTVVLDRDNNNWKGAGSTYLPDSGRLHDANDAVIVGVLGGDIY